MSQTFQKKIEDFVCDHCGEKVIGNGYTNHCPQCLWSKHVDVFPGDRDAKCLGLMKPVAVSQKGNKYVITHKCVVCGHEKPNEMSPDDNFDVAIATVKQLYDK